MELITFLLYLSRMDTTIKFRCKVLLGIMMDQLSRRGLEHFHCTLDHEKHDNEYKITLTLSNGLFKGTSSYFTSKRSDRIIAYSAPSGERGLKSFANIVYTAFDFNSKEDQNSVAFHMINEAIETLINNPIPTKDQKSLLKSPVFL